MLKVYLSSDHVTAATGKTVAVTISKNGGAFGNPNAGATNATEVASGWYKVTLDTTDTNTLADLVVRGTATACDDTEQVMQVISATTGGATNLDAAVSTIKAKTDSLTFTVAGVLDAAVTHWVATAVATVDTAGYPVVTVKDGTGIGELNTSGGRVSADVARWLGTAVATPTVAGVPQVEVIDISAAGQTDVRASVGLAAANLDTQIGTLATAANLATVASYIDTEITTLQTSVDDLPTNAELATALGTADDAVLVQVALVKAKTDGLTFTVAGVLDANIQYVNDVQITGNGQTGTEWGP
jgi:hypothetical protein